jgi:sugar phosphate isomerase/epimerase
VHAPITDVFAGGKPGRLFSTATRDNAARKETVAEIAAALDISRIIPFHFLVVHLGIPNALKPGPEENNVDAALRSVEEIHRLADAAGARVAPEIMGNSLSTAPAIVDLIDRSFDDADLGICMDVGHAHLLGDAADAIETSGEYLFTTHIHDNRRQSDDHLVPFRGSINWAGTIMAFEKIGYDGVLMYEVTNTEPPAAVLASAVNARRRLEALLAAGSQMPADDSP